MALHYADSETAADNAASGNSNNWERTFCRENNDRLFGCSEAINTDLGNSIFNVKKLPF